MILSTYMARAAAGSLTFYLALTNTANAASIREKAYEAACKRGLDPALVFAIIEVESGWNEKAIGKQGDLGLMQILPRYHKGVSLDVDTNLRIGTGYLASLRKTCTRKFGNLWFACYNSKNAKIVLSHKQDAYAKKVMREYERERKQLGTRGTNCTGFHRP